MTKVQAELRALDSPDVKDLETFEPAESFGFLLMMLVGPRDEKGEESFDVTVCSPAWFASNMNSNVVSGRHFLFMKKYNYTLLREFIESYCNSCRGQSWEEVAVKVARIGHWEFEDYRP